MFKGNNETAQLMSTSVNVQALGVKGNDVDCHITGSDVTDDAIFLELDKQYDIAITLDPGSTGVKFHQTKPFCNQNSKCPPELPGGNATHPFSVTRNSDTSLTIHAAPVHSRAVAHYRLNFDGGESCDPIIIHE
jgi:hypothetical protein